MRHAPIVCHLQNSVNDRCGWVSPNGRGGAPCSAVPEAAHCTPMSFGLLSRPSLSASRPRFVLSTMGPTMRRRCGWACVKDVSVETLHLPALASARRLQVRHAHHNTRRVGERWSDGRDRGPAQSLSRLSRARQQVTLLEARRSTPSPRALPGPGEQPSTVTCPSRPGEQVRWG